MFVRGHGWRGAFLVGLAAALMWGAGLRAVAAEREGAAGVEELVAQLQSDDWRAREGAVEKIVALGEGALPRLREVLSKTTDNEVRSRVASAIARIEDQRRVGASLVTLTVSDVPASDAFAEVFRQAQATLVTEPADLLAKGGKRVSLRVERRPFWEVVQSLCAQAGVEPGTIERHGREDGLGIVAAKSGGRAWDDRPVVLAGPLLVRAERLELVSGMRLRAPRAVSREFHIILSALAEPKLKVLDYSGVLKLEEVKDENGNSLIPVDDQGLPANAEVFGNADGGRPGMWEMGATLHYPEENRGKKVARFKASCAFEVVTEVGVLDVALKDAGGKWVRGVEKTVGEKTAGKLRMLVKGLDEAAGRCGVVVYRDGRNDTEWQRLRGLIHAGQGRLLDGEGKTLAWTPGGVDAVDNEEAEQMEVGLRFEPGPRGAGGTGSWSKAARLVWEFPVETRQVVAPFEFRDLPIP